MKESILKKTGTTLHLERLSHDEIIYLWTRRCQHGHRYLVHYKCFINEEQVPERIGCLDIEASNLKANFGIMFSWGLKPLGKPTVYDHIVGKELKNGVLDRRIIQSLVDELRNYDRVVVHYGSSYRFDLPFIRTRALMLGVPFLHYGELSVTDTFAIAKAKLCLHSRRQDVIAEAVQGDNIKTRIDTKHWIEAMMGKKAAIAYIVDHNIKDCIQLEKNYLALRPFVKESKTSI